MSRSFVTLAIIAIVLAANGITLGTAETAPPANLKYRVVAPGISRAEPAPTPSPTPKPAPYAGPVAWLYLASAGVSGQWPVESRDTTFVSGADMVVAVEAEGDAVAYPVRQMAYHHLVNDDVGTLPVVSTY